jgi:membrane protease YdiL (CAAX protease family)
MVLSSEINFFLKEENDLLICFPILISLLAFICYWFMAKSNKIKSLFYVKNSKDSASVKHIFFCKVLGLILMGIVPVVSFLALFPSYHLKDIGLSINYETISFTLKWILILAIITVPITFISAKKEKNLVNYPQIRAKKWNRKILTINLLGWSLYLFGYEVLFRGILLFPLVDSIGIWPAIAINIALYSATHIPKGLDETIGAIPLGLVLCILTILSQTIWIAFFAHVFMAWTNSITALKYHPEINYQKKGIQQDN